jgi:hypothetical protein
MGLLLQTTESANHLFVNCHLIIRIGNSSRNGLGSKGFILGNWGLNINEWWSLLAYGATPQCKTLASLTLLAVWDFRMKEILWF